MKNLMDSAATAFAQFMQRGGNNNKGQEQQSDQVQAQQQQSMQFSMAPKQAPVPDTVDKDDTNSSDDVNDESNKKDKEKKRRGSNIPHFRSSSFSSSSKQASKVHSSSSSTPARDPEDIDESSISTSGKMLLQWLEDLTLIPSRDQSLRQLWDRIQEEEISQKALRQNRRLLNAQLRQAKVHLPIDQLTALDDLLSRVPLNKEQIREAVLFAVRLQAGALNLALTHVETDSHCTFHDGEEAVKPLEIWAMDHALTQTVARLPSVSKSHAALRPRTATGSLLNGLTREDLNAMNLDKHERQLLSNVVIPSEIGVTYNMIGGLKEAKELLRQSVTYPLKYPRLYSEGVAAEAVKGVLLFGPPGTGKTLLAKAVATEGGAAFLAVDASTIENKWLGESEKNARAVFTLARKLAPCVIYLDEVDSVLASREHGDDSSHGTLTSVKTTLMQEWDGLRTTKEDRVVVIASTNRPFDLDEAVLRRLPRRIMVDLPDLHTRQEILAVTLMHNRLAPDVNLTTLAEQLDGFTGSDVKEVCREAVVRVAHERAHRLETGSHHYIESTKLPQVAEKNGDENKQDHESIDWSAPLRPVTMNDFLEVLKKLKASVDDAGREMQKVVEWNEKYGEVKRKTKRRPAQLSMYI
jgi:ATP-dependent 26S proteasome regulatory subunit